MNTVSNIKKLVNELSFEIEKAKSMGLKVVINMPSEYSLSTEKPSVKLWKEIT